MIRIGSMFIGLLAVICLAAGPASALVATVGAVKETPIGTSIQIANKVVSAGTDQLVGSFFYIQDETGGIRVRTSQTVHQGDKVTVTGVVARASDGGIAVKRNGELEINAAGTGGVVSVTPGPFTLPRAVAMKNRNIGGGPFGLIQPDSYPSQPGVYSAGVSPIQISEMGLNNVGRLVRVWGLVLYANDSNHVLYLDDGSGIKDGSLFPNSTYPQRGLRVLVKPSVVLSGLLGAYVVVQGVVGCNSASEMGSTDNINNVRFIRLIQETFTDTNGNGQWDPGEPYVDANGSGVCDGIMIVRDAPLPTDLRFDIVTFCCPCSLTDHFCDPQFAEMNWKSPNGHYLAMGSDAQKDSIEANGNSLAAYYNTLTDDWLTLTGEQKADEIEVHFTAYFPRGVPQWIILNEISASQWPSNAAYRAWVHDVVHKLANTYGHKVILYSPFPTPGQTAQTGRRWLRTLTSGSSVT